MNKKIILSLIAFFAMNQSFAANVATGNSSVKIVPAIAIQAGNPLAFGSIATGTAGSVIIAPDSTTNANGVTLVSNGAARTAGSFNVTGEAGATYTASIPTSITLVDNTNNDAATNSMTVTALTSSSNRTLTNGADTLSIGGTLNVAANQLPGNYAGEYLVTVNY